MTKTVYSIGCVFKRESIETPISWVGIVLASSLEDAKDVLITKINQAHKAFEKVTEIKVTKIEDRELSINDDGPAKLLAVVDHQMVSYFTE